MKTNKNLLITLLVLLFNSQIFASTIGVGPIKTFGIFADSEIVSTISQLELIKMNKYQVLDRFDMQEVENYTDFQTCYGKSCLIEYGKQLNVDFMLSGNVDGLGNKIVITLKLLSIADERIIKTHTAEFDNQEAELQRMIGIVLHELHDLDVDPIIKKQLSFKNEEITSNNVGRVKNSGPRMGVGYAVGSFNEFATRSASEGGLEISPFVSNFGYQFEAQYVGTENFSALFEGIVNFTGLEQGKFIPSFAILNGFRFGKQGWEFAFGPSFGLSKSSMGFFTSDDKNSFGLETGRYWSQKEFEASPFAENTIDSYGYEYSRNLDVRGRLDISTRWIMAIGRTFQSGALNIPVNVFYSSQKGGGMAGLSVGFNIIRKKTNIN